MSEQKLVVQGNQWHMMGPISISNEWGDLVTEVCKYLTKSDPPDKLGVGGTGYPVHYGKIDNCFIYFNDIYDRLWMIIGDEIIFQRGKNSNTLWMGSNLNCPDYAEISKSDFVNLINREKIKASKLNPHNDSFINTLLK